MSSGNSVVGGQVSDQSWRHWPHELAFIAVSYGLYLAYFPLGPVGTASIVATGASWWQVLAARLCFIAATVVAMVFWKAAGGSDLIHRRGANAASFLVAVAVIAIEQLAVPLATRPWAIVLCQAVLGAALATPKLACYEVMAAAYRELGRSPCVACVATSFLVAVLPTPLISLMGAGDAASFAIMASLVMTSGALMGLAARGRGLATLAPSGNDRTAYHTSRHAKSILVVSGSTWVLTFSIAVNMGFGTGVQHLSTWAVALVGAVLDGLVIAIFVRSKQIESVRFGTLLHILLAVSGAVWVAIPLLSTWAPIITCVVCAAVYVMQSILMILFIAEVSDEYKTSVCTVTVAHYGIFVLSAIVAGVGYFLAFRFLDERTAYEAISAVSVALTLLSVMVLPDKSGRAIVYAADERTDHGGFGEQVPGTVERLAADCRLTPRESEILPMLVSGMKREQMAEALSISPWTVKRHVASIYEKTGAHSARELDLLAKIHADRQP